MSADRKAEISAGLDAVRRRVDAACRAADRHPGEVTLVAVTKTFPTTDIRWLAELGVAEIGENRDQEARPKVAELTDLDLRWHFVGQLQSNKCGSIASYAHLVHSVDRPRVVAALAAGAEAAHRVVDVLVQVALDDEPRRGGAAVADVPSLADRVVAAAGLRLAGVMAVAPLDQPPAAAFDRLATIAASVRTAHPDARVISAGMSGDLEAAIACGATHVRVGTALLGGRPPLVR